MNEKLNKLKKEIKDISLEFYLLCVGFFLLFSGFALFTYDAIKNISMILFSSSLSLLILGFSVLISYLFVKHIELKECDIIGNS